MAVRSVSRAGLVEYAARMHQGVYEPHELMLRLLGHPLLYEFLCPCYGLLHPHLNMMEKGVHLYSNVWTHARRTTAAIGGVDLKEIWALLAACEEEGRVGSACSGMEG